MKELLLKARLGDTNEILEEAFDASELVDPAAPVRTRARAPTISVSTQEAADQWGRSILDRFNQSRRSPEHEPKRHFVSTQLREVSDGC